MKTVTRLEFYENELAKYNAQLQALETSSDYENFPDKKRDLKDFYQYKIKEYEKGIANERAKNIQVKNAVEVPYASK